MFKNMTTIFNTITQWFLIRVDQGRNPHCRTYHTMFRISDCPIETFIPPVGTEDVSEGLKSVGEVGTSILHRLFEIPGIKIIYIKEYLLTIVIDPDSSWKEVQPKILDGIIPY